MLAVIYFVQNQLREIQKRILRKIGRVKGRAVRHTQNWQGVRQASVPARCTVISSVDISGSDQADLGFASIKAAVELGVDSICRISASRVEKLRLC